MSPPTGADGTLQIQVPGDKSVTHRALLFGALATGVTRIRRPLVSEDTQATAAALRQMGVRVSDLASSEVTVEGVGLRGLREPSGVIDCGNSGTTCRLLLGILAGQSFTATMTGDASLRARPMARVTDLLAKMGASFEWGDEEGKLPVTVRGRTLRSIDIGTGVASAQVKSAVLLAALTSGEFALVTEPRPSRDHTERLLSAMGAATICHPGQGGWRVELRDPPSSLKSVDITVPGDFSTAAFPLVWGLCRKEGPPLALTGVGLNPTRTGLLGVLRRMGAQIDVIEDPLSGGEPTGTLIVHASRLQGTEVVESEVPAMVDEIPALVVAALYAEGETRIRGASELRVKESDRIDALGRNLRNMGVEVDEAPDGLSLRGRPDGPSNFQGTVETFGDHRIEMAFGVVETLTGGAVTTASRDAAAVSYPDFWSEMNRLATENHSPQSRPPLTRPPVVTIDGPAGSGKSTTARAVAQSLGLVHLDSGALYRAVACTLLDNGVSPGEWGTLPTSYFSGLGLSAEVEDGHVALRRNGALLDDDRLRTPEVTAAVSPVAALPAVREALIGLQRDAAANGGLVVDGRDLGTVVYPDADVKFFFIANLEERARRRVLERSEQEPGTSPTSGEDTGEAEVVAMAQRLNARDFEDTHRAHSPLRRPHDAIVIDTTHLTPDQQLAQVLDHVRAVWTPEGK